ncbi:hypothetical protein ABZ671_00965 [Micromonospora sp. NPDC006766]|uniref:hypothetical protein n=1 Tax=Micromonospora sp. NPDC006766 TaxID=3154778 RepID=UPI0033EA18AC
MSERYYRVQTAARDVNELLDPGYQFSHAYNGNTALTREGVSVCADLDDLAEYLMSGMAGALNVRDGGWVIVEVEADEIADARPVDGEYELLVRPTAIISVTPVGDDFLALLDEKEAFLASFLDTPAFDD